MWKWMYDSWKAKWRTKKYEEFSATEKIQADCDLKATNIILQGLPSYVYSLLNHHRVSKDLWERVQLLMKAKKFFQPKTTKIFQMEKVDCSTGFREDKVHYCGEGHMARTCAKAKRKRDATWFRDKVLLVEGQGSGKVLNEEELAFLADPRVAEGPNT
ncbi:hypothetical protein Tco_0690960 [Tanacetum coccineum]